MGPRSTRRAPVHMVFVLFWSAISATGIAIGAPEKDGGIITMDRGRNIPMVAVSGNMFDSLIACKASTLFDTFASHALYRIRVTPAIVWTCSLSGDLRHL